MRKLVITSWILPVWSVLDINVYLNLYVWARLSYWANFNLKQTWIHDTLNLNKIKLHGNQWGKFMSSVLTWLKDKMKYTYKAFAK